MDNKVSKYTIELDCAPGPRPEVFFDSLFEDTELSPDDFEITSKFFGNWQWTLKDSSKDELYAKYQGQIKDRITKLYKLGRIRYGSW